MPVLQLGEGQQGQEGQEPASNPTVEAMVTSQVEGLQRTVAALELGPEADALVAYCFGLAEALDACPEKAALWREYRPALELLLRVGEVEEDDGQAAFLRLVRPPIRDAADTGTG